MSTYAKNTEVSSDISRREIERTLARYGAGSFAYGWNAGHAMVGFEMHQRQLRFVLPLPDRKSREFTHTPARGTRRSASAAEAAYEQAVKQKWRALALVIKAKLEAVESGIVDFDSEFLAHIVLPGGQTVGEQIVPQMDDALETGRPPELLAIGRGGD